VDRTGEFGRGTKKGKGREIKFEGKNTFLKVLGSGHAFGVLIFSIF